MLIGFLSHLEYCHEIKDKNILKLLSSDSNYTGDNEYFFPGLVKIKKNLRACGKYLVNNPIDVAGCFRLQMHTHSQICSVLLLRITFSYPFAVMNRRI